MSSENGHVPPSDAGELPPLDRAEPTRSSPFRSRRMRITLGLLVLLAVLVAILPRHADVSRTLPPGRFGATIRCLERDQLDEIRDVRTDALPTRSTVGVVVDQTRGPSLAELRLAAGPAAARQLARHLDTFSAIDPDVGLVQGSIAYAYALGGSYPHVLANGGQRTLIDFCIRTPDRR